jgi:hypothetical protein
MAKKAFKRAHIATPPPVAKLAFFARGACAINHSLSVCAWLAAIVPDRLVGMVQRFRKITW